MLAMVNVMFEFAQTTEGPHVASARLTQNSRRLSMICRFRPDYLKAVVCHSRVEFVRCMIVLLK
jgi:hypothetical protein